MPNQTVGDLLGAIERIGPVIAEHAATAEADRQLSGAVYQPSGLRLGCRDETLVRGGTRRGDQHQ